uniref:Uncharacterized protein n=1 Tax=Aegilops tauschii TaxID=37682 RepID=M8B4A1_AEGTA
MSIVLSMRRKVCQGNRRGSNREAIKGETTTPLELPTDVIVSILLRLPPSSRRLSRLVCRQWRDAVDTRTTEMQSRAKPLVVTSTGSAGVVGTCNGLICLCDNQKIVGAISLVNPVTGENMPVPEAPDCAKVRGHSVSPHEMYGFAYHPTTGRYKIVHVPCFYGGREGRRKYHVVPGRRHGQQRELRKKKKLAPKSAK